MNFVILIFLFIIGTFFIIQFILHFILFLSYQFDSPEFNNLLSNWKKTPIINFSTTFNEEEGYDKNDFIKINETTIFVKRMNKKYNFPYLKVREYKFHYHKICGTDFKNNFIYFKMEEQCPVSYINYSSVNDCNINEICLEITSSYFLKYSNNYYYNNDNEYYYNYYYYDYQYWYNKKIAIDINSTNSTNLTIISYNSTKYYDIPYNFERIFEFISRIKINNKIILIFLLIILVLIILTLVDINKYLFVIINFLLISFTILLIISFSYGVYWTNQINSMLNDLNFSKFMMKRSLCIMQKTSLSYSFFLFISVLSYSFYLTNLKIKENIKNVILLLCIPIPLSCIILIIIDTLKPFCNSGLFNELKLNYKMSPIIDIQISNYNKNNKDSSYFNSKVPYKFNYPIYENSDFSKYMIEWKNISFYITRMNKKYTYPYIINHNSKNTKLCGNDSIYNELYFPKDVICPINYIEFTNSSTPSLNDEYEWITKQLNNNTYMHYTNGYTEGTILIDFKIIKYDYSIFVYNSNKFSEIDIDDSNKSLKLNYKMSPNY